ncbi:hypothetical protein LSAT2_002750 [Lamellibrachia satsuma]|nr:hypothetical protein LSAT2_002750 [Lamellibrachia satsuma]
MCMWSASHSPGNGSKHNTNAATRYTLNCCSLAYVLSLSVRSKASTHRPWLSHSPTPSCVFHVVSRTF